MKGQTQISDKEKWQAIISCDKSFDGAFLYGVRTTGIFCRPSCKSKAPIHENVMFFSSMAEAMQQGFRPCKRCRPDRESYEPGWELVEKARNCFDSDFESIGLLGNTAEQLGVSMNHLTKLFSQQMGKTPSRYVAELRIKKTAELLANTDKDILEIAYMSGFRSMSGFYRCFRQLTGYTPKEYRKTGGKQDAVVLL